MLNKKTKFYNNLLFSSLPRSLNAQLAYFLSSVVDHCHLATSAKLATNLLSKIFPKILLHLLLLFTLITTHLKVVGHVVHN